MVAWRRRKVVEEDSALGTVRRLQPLWYELADSEITKWVGLDFTTGLDNDTHFLGREDPFRQLGFLRAERVEGAPIDFRHVFWMDGFGFWLQQEPAPYPRLRQRTRLPISLTSQLDA
jgi:hypothetical protein